MAVLCADFDICALCRLESGAKVHKGNAHDNVAAGALKQRLCLFDKSLGLGGSFVHLPVAGDNGFSQIFIHLKGLLKRIIYR